MKRIIVEKSTDYAKPHLDLFQFYYNINLWFSLRDTLAWAVLSGLS